MLANRDGQHLKPLGFFHHALSQHETKYSTTEKELLAVVLGVKRFRVYLSSGPFELITDHQALRWLNSLDAYDERGRRGRWIDFLQQFQIRPVHKAGKHPDMTIADYLSRVGPTGDLVASVSSDTLGLEPDLTTTVFTADQLRAEQRMDQQISPVRAALLNGQNLPSKSPESARTLYRFRRHLSMGQDGILRYMFNGGRNRLPVIPCGMRAEALRLIHDAPLSGHMGRDRTWKRARDTFWWPNMKQDVSTYVNGCEMCGQNKLPKNPGRAPLQHTEIPSRPLAKLQVDFVGPFPQTDAHPFRYVLQVQDIFSRYLMLLPAEDNTAETAARLVHSRWICTFDVPMEITSDRGPHFAAETFQAMCRRIGTRHVMGAPLHAQSQGQVERQNQLMANLRCMYCNDVRVWPTNIYQLQFSHNTSLNSATGFSPFEMLFARPACRPDSGIGGDSGDPGSTSQTFNTPSQEVTERRRLLDEIQGEAQVSVRHAQDVRVERSLAKTRGQPFEAGDLVRLRLTTAERGRLGGKMSPVLSPLYRVTEVLRGGWTYRVSRVHKSGRRKMDIKIRHYNDLTRSTVDVCEGRGSEATADSGDDDSSDDDDDGVQDSDSDLQDGDGDDGGPIRDERPRRQCGPPERLVVDPSRRSYESRKLRWGVR